MKRLFKQFKVFYRLKKEEFLQWYERTDFWMLSYNISALIILFGLFYLSELFFWVKFVFVSLLILFFVFILLYCVYTAIIFLWDNWKKAGDIINEEERKGKSSLDASSWDVSSVKKLSDEKKNWLKRANKFIDGEE